MDGWGSWNGHSLRLISVAAGVSILCSTIKPGIGHINYVSGRGGAEWSIGHACPFVPGFHATAPARVGIRCSVGIDGPNCRPRRGHGWLDRGTVLLTLDHSVSPCGHSVPPRATTDLQFVPR